jgi:hypothetical protein
MYGGYFAVGCCTDIEKEFHNKSFTQRQLTSILKSMALVISSVLQNLFVSRPIGRSLRSWARTQSRSSSLTSEAGW